MEDLHTSLLLNEELVVASERLSILWTPLLAGDPMLARISAEADADRGAIVAAGSRQAASDFTGPLGEADARRDAAFMTLRDFTDGWVSNPVATPEQAAAAGRLQAIFSTHGRTLHRLGYTRQSGKMTQLLSDLAKPTSVADLAALGLTAVEGALRSAQGEFEQLKSDKAATEGGTELPSVTRHRGPLARRMGLILGALEEIEELAPTPALETAIEAMDGVIVSIMGPARARQTAGQSAPPPVAAA